MPHLFFAPFFKNNIDQYRGAIIGIIAFASFNSSVIAQPQTWTLTSTAQRVLQEAPQRGAVEAETEARKGSLAQASAWPNPSLALGASNSMGLDDAQGGTDFNSISINQPLPISGRLGKQRKQADANVKQAQANVAQQGLLLEYEAARIFHGLQFSHARLRIAEERLKSADEFQRIGRRREQADDLSRLARLRLDLVRETAKQQVARATGKLSESLSDFQTVINKIELNPQFEPMAQFPMLPSLSELETQLHSHPVLMAARQGVEAARHGVTIARASRFVDPELWLSRQRDVLNNRRQDFTAFGVSMTLPLWNMNKGNIDAAQANKQKTQFTAAVLQRQLANNLRLSHLHLSHLIVQGKQYRTNVLEPAKEIFRLSSKGFATGQVAILNLVDAVNTYFDARVRYLELLQAAWMEAASLRRAAGRSLLVNQTDVLEIPALEIPNQGNRS